MKQVAGQVGAMGRHGSRRKLNRGSGNPGFHIMPPLKTGGGHARLCLALIGAAAFAPSALASGTCLVEVALPQFA